MNTMIEARHWEDVDLKTWRWPHFPPAEMACRGTGRLKVSVRLLDMLEALRAKLGGKPMIVRSAYRTESHNRAVGGAPNSLHMQGIACDISMANHDPMEFEVAARAVGFTGFGFYSEPENNFCHIDLGPAREWGKRWPINAKTYSPETPPNRVDALKKSAQVAGGGAVSLGAIEASMNALREQLTPYEAALDWVRYAIIALAVIAGGIAIWRAIKS